MCDKLFILLTCIIFPGLCPNFILITFVQWACYYTTWFWLIDFDSSKIFILSKIVLLFIEIAILLDFDWSKISILITYTFYLMNCLYSMVLIDLFRSIVDSGRRRSRCYARWSATRLTWRVDYASWSEKTTSKYTALSTSRDQKIYPWSMHMRLLICTL